MTESGPRRHRASTSAPVQRLLGARARVAPGLQRRYRTALAAGLAFALVAGVSAAAVVEEDATAARADLAALGLEVEHPVSPGIAVPEGEDLELGELDVDVQLGKDNVMHLREGEIAARNAERRAIAERQAAERQAAERQAAERQAAIEREQAARTQPVRQEPRAQAERAPAQAERAPAQAERAPAQAERAPAQAQQAAPAQESRPQTQAASAGQGGERGALASMVNGLRAQNGLGALGRDGTLDAVAQDWAQWMASNQVLQHNPNYRSQIGGGWSRSGENIVRNTGAQSWSSGDITSWMFNWWASSAPHRANMLNTAYTNVGVGYAMGSGGPYAVLVFGGR